MLLPVKLEILLLLLAPITVCRIDAAKGHSSRSSVKSATVGVRSTKNSTKIETFASPKQKKRWMPAFAGFGGRDPADSIAFDNQYSQDALFGANQEPMSYGNVGYGVEGVTYKYPTVSSSEAKPYTGDDTQMTYEQEMASYLKPGIGDYPSDMPAGYKGDEGLGLVGESHSKGGRLPPSAMFGTHQDAGSLLGKGKGEGVSDQMLASSSLAPAKVTEPGSKLAAAAAATAASATGLPEAETLSKAVASIEKDGESPENHKHKPVTGARRQGELFQLASQASFEPIGLPQVTPPNLYGSFGGALKGINAFGPTDSLTSDFAASNTPESSSVLDIGENVNNKLASTSSLHKGAKDDTSDADAVGGKASLKEGKNAKDSEKLLKVKLVSSLRKALLKNLGNVMGTKLEGDDTASGDSESTASKEEDKAEVKQDSGDGAKSENAVKASEPEQASELENEKEEQLESNLMKIDKKKLVHLLATFIKKNKRQFDDDNDEDEDVGHSGDGAKTQTVMVQDISSKHFKSDETNLGSPLEASNLDKSAASDGEAVKQGRLEKQKVTEGGDERKPKKHVSRTGHLVIDPYAQIGLVDPSNNDKLTLETSSRHDLEKSKSDNKEHDKQLTSDSDRAKTSQRLKQKSKEVKETKETSPKEETADVSEDDDKKELEKLKGYAKEQKEREDLKELKKFQEEKEDSKNTEKDDESVETTDRVDSKKLNGSKDKESMDDTEAKSRKEKMKKVKAMIDAASANFINPEVVKVIAAKLREEALNAKQEKQQATADDGNEKDDSEDGKGKGKEKQSKDEKEESEATASTDTEENSKEAAADTTTSVATDGPNLQTLIEHMKQRLQASKESKESGKSKSKRARKVLALDDAYAQIGAMDPNVRKRKTITRKHHIHRTDS